MNERLNKKIFGFTSMAPVYSRASEVISELEKDLNELEEKWKEVLPFGFLICPEVSNSNVELKSSARLDRKMYVSITGEYYPNDAAILITISIPNKDIGNIMYENDIKDGIKEIPQSNLDNSKRIIGQELSLMIPIILKKQEKNYPKIKAYSDEFNNEFQMVLMKSGWIKGVSKEEYILEEEEDRDEILNQSHPTFKKHFTNDLYYNYVDEDTVFGSDTGFDVLNLCIEAYKEDPQVLFEDLGHKIVGEVFKVENHEFLKSLVYLATGVAEIKLTGKSTEEVRNFMTNGLNYLLKHYNNKNLEIIKKDLSLFVTDIRDI